MRRRERREEASSARPHTPDCFQGPHTLRDFFQGSTAGALALGEVHAAEEVLEAGIVAEGIEAWANR